MVFNAVTLESVGPTRYTMEDISFQDIEGFDDVFAIMQLATEKGIKLDGCCSTEDMKERFVMHKKKLMEHNEKTVRLCESMKKDMDKKREALIPIFSSVKDALLPGLHCIQDILSAKGISTDLCRDIDRGVTALSSRESCVVIAGATGAGKSTFLNLLLGMNLLPEHVLSCTATVCKLKYDTRFRAQVLLKDGNSRTFSFQDFEDAKSGLESEIFIRDLNKREQIDMSLAKEINIFIPADILKCGITIVDTPGIDENEAMDDLVRTFITTNHIAAFIYIVKSDVQQYGLLNFLESLLEKRSSESTTLLTNFNPNAAMFICNKWDLIPDEDKQRVKEHVYKKLEAVWTGLEESQVKFFSTKNTRFHLEVDKDYKTEDFRSLQKDLEQLFVTAMQSTIDVYYNWLKQVLEECTLFTKTIISRLKTTQEEQEEKFANALEKMETLKGHASEILSYLRGQIDQEIKHMTNIIRRYIQQPHIKLQLQSWTDDETPFSDFSRIKDVNPQTIFERRDLAILRRLFDIIDSWEKAQEFKRHIEAKMDNQIKEKLFLLDDEMKKISNDLKDSDSVKSSLSSSQSTISFEEEDLADDIALRSFNSGVVGRLSTFVQTVHSSSSNTISKALVAGAVQPILNKVIKAKFYMQLRRTSSVVSDAYMYERAGSILKGLLSNDELLIKVVERYTCKERDQLDSIEKNIPKFVQANNRLIDEVRSLREQTQQKQSIVREMTLALKHQTDQLRGFDGMFIKKIAPHDVSLLFDEINLGTSSMTEENSLQRRDANICLWALLQKGFLNIRTDQKPVMVKLYFKPLNDNDLFKEISRLRCLDHPSISTFSGMTRVEKHNAFVYDDHLTSARRYLKRGSVSRRNAVPRILEGLLEGLEQIHKQQLVHMELTQDTVMVNSIGEVKLCGACLPRQAKFPMDTYAVEAGEFTCLSPEVLHGKTYDTKSDIYSFGLLVWQLILKEQPYQSQFRMKLSEFIETVNPQQMLKIPTVSEILWKLLQDCILPEPASRCKMADIREQLKMLKDDPVVTDMQNTYIRTKVLKRQSKVTSY